MTVHQLTVLSAEASAYQHLIAARLPANVTLLNVTDDPKQVDTDSTTILLADPDLAASVIPSMANLAWCQSIWAGNRPLLQLDKQDYVLTVAKGIFGVQMREYVFTYLLHFARAVDDFKQAQYSAVSPKWAPPAYARLKGQTLGIIGAGSIASALLPVARAFEMKVVALTRTGQSDHNFDVVYTGSDMSAFCAQCDYVLNLMPDTPQTKGMLNAAFFSALPDHCVLINAGRGSAIVEQDLLAALDTQQLRAAVLDVFTTEPLPDDHPFWSHPKIYITQHTAAESQPEDVVALFEENLQRYLRSEPLHHQLDFTRGY